MVGRWLITGGCGFIGTSLVKRILSDNENAHICILDNFQVGAPEDLAEVCQFTLQSPGDISSKAGVYLVEGDIRDAELCGRITENINCIVHLAANTGVGPSVENPRFDMECNIVGTFNILESARKNGVERFVFASSGAPAGIVEPPIHEEMAPHPVSPYGSSKLAGEGYCSSYYHTFGIKTVSLRFGNVYGPRSKHKSSVVAKFIRQAMNNQVCEIYGDGTQTRDFIYIDDLIEAIVKASEFDGGGEVFQIAAGAEVTLSELVGLMKVQLKNVLGIEMQIKNASPRLGDVARNFADTSKAKKVLGWQPRTRLEEGLLKTINDLAG